MTSFLLAQATTPDLAVPGFLFGMVGLLLVFGILSSIFWIWMIVDCATNRRLNDTNKIVWILVICLLHFIGALVYFFAGRGGRSQVG